MLDIEKRLNIKFPKEYIDFINNMKTIYAYIMILIEKMHLR